MNKNSHIPPVIILTGATGGIGSAVIEKLAQRNAILVGVSRHPHGENRSGSRADNYFEISADLSNAEGWSELVHVVLENFGRIDALIQCAGILVPGGFEQLSEREISDVISTNFLGTVSGVRSVLPVMRKQGAGSIVIIGSLGGAVPMPYQSIYAASKFALRGFCLSVQEELNHSGIHLSLITPGAVNTALLRKSIADDRGCISFLLNPIAPEKVAAAIVRALDHPRREIVLPSAMGRLAMLLSFYPPLMTAVHTLLAPLARRRARKYSTSKPVTEGI